MIPEFNALGNHPDDMGAYLLGHLPSALDRLGASADCPRILGVLEDALDDLSRRPGGFTGHHVPTPAMRKATEVFMRLLVRPEACEFIGMENYEHARELLKGGANVLIVQNHTSPVDALPFLQYVWARYGDRELPSIVMSQVFEYARITGLLTSGLEKFPVFQPKHVARFEGVRGGEVVKEMRRQNLSTMRSIVSSTRQGGHAMFLYPERDRNVDDMGAPEPVVMRIPEIVSRSPHPLYILPMHVSGIGSILPNRPGVNELDVFFESMNKGQGTIRCGPPVEFAKIVHAADHVAQPAIMAQGILDRPPHNATEQELANRAGLFLGLVDRLRPPSDQPRRYGHRLITEALSELTK